MAFFSSMASQNRSCLIPTSSCFPHTKQDRRQTEISGHKSQLHPTKNTRSFLDVEQPKNIPPLTAAKTQYELRRKSTSSDFRSPAVFSSCYDWYGMVLFFFFLLLLFSQLFSASETFYSTQFTNLLFIPPFTMADWNYSDPNHQPDYTDPNQSSYNPNHPSHNNTPYGGHGTNAHGNNNTPYRGHGTNTHGNNNTPYGGHTGQHQQTFASPGAGYGYGTQQGPGSKDLAMVATLDPLGVSMDLVPRPLLPLPLTVPLPRI